MSIASKITNLVVMAAGRGNKLGILTSHTLRAHEGNLAACCLPVGGRRNINRIIQQAADYGVTNISVVSHHLAGDVIAGVGNGEIFEKNLGEKTPLGLKRGLNAQWNKGGLQYAIPIR